MSDDGQKKPKNLIQNVIQQTQINCLTQAFDK